MMKLLGVKVAPDLAEELRRRAAADDRSLSGFVRRLLRDALDRAAR